MNDLIAFELFMRNNLHDWLAARALIDFREELLNEPHRVAVRAVAAIRRQERNARDLARAAKHMRPGSKVGGLLRVHVKGSAGFDPMGACQIVLVAGSRPPVEKSVYQHNPGAFWYETIITVGARWVNRCAVELLADMQADEQADAAAGAASAAP